MADGRVETDGQLDGVFLGRGMRYGATAHASFGRLPEEKCVKCTVCGRDTVCTLTDYARGMPEGAAEELADMLIRRALAGRKEAVFGKGFLDFVAEPDTIARNRDIFFGRHLLTPVGKNRDLNDSIQRLEEMGLISDSEVPPCAVWLTMRPEEDIAVSRLHRIAFVSTSFDAPSQSTDATDRAVFLAVSLANVPWDGMRRRVPREAVRKAIETWGTEGL